MTEHDPAPAPNTGDEFVVVGEFLPQKSICSRMRGDTGGSYGVSRERMGGDRAQAVIPSRCDNAAASWVKTGPHGASWIRMGPPQHLGSLFRKKKWSGR